MIDEKQLRKTAIDSAKEAGANAFPLKLANAAYGTATNTGDDRTAAALGGARDIVGEGVKEGLTAAGAAGDKGLFGLNNAGVASKAVGAAIGLGNVLSKPEGSDERAQAAQKELVSAAGIVPVAGPLAAQVLVDKINKEFGKPEGEVKEGDGFDVKGSFNGELNSNGDIKVGDQTVSSRHDPAAGNVDDVQVNGQLNGDNARILSDGSIDTGNGQVVTPEGDIKGGGSTVTEGDDFQVRGELNGDNATDSRGTIDTGNGQLVTPEGDIVGQGPISDAQAGGESSSQSAGE